MITEQEIILLDIGSHDEVYRLKLQGTAGSWTGDNLPSQTCLFKEGIEPFNPQTHHRRSIRLQEFDYSDAGAYFVTICAIERRCLFGEVEVGTVRLNDAGLIIQECWDAMPEHFPHVELDAFVIMPNHLHGIVVLNDGKINGPVAVT